MKLVSILIICRPGRPDLITGALQSLVDKTADTSRVEILVKVDVGDDETLKAVEKFYDKLLVTVTRMDGSKGAGAVDIYVNNLAKQSSGGLIWFWSDEVQMLTPGWDGLLAGRNIDPNTIQLVHPAWDNTAGAVYPMITRKWLETTGRWTGACNLDSWVAEMILRSRGKIPVTMVTDLIIKDVTFVGETKVTHQGVAGKDFTSPEIQAEINKDLNKLMANL